MTQSGGPLQDTQRPVNTLGTYKASSCHKILPREPMWEESSGLWAANCRSATVSSQTSVSFPMGH